jgi:hypothetical protein
VEYTSGQRATYRISAPPLPELSTALLILKQLDPPHTLPCSDESEAGTRKESTNPASKRSAREQLQKYDRHDPPTLESIWKLKLRAWEGSSRSSTPAAARSCSAGDALRLPAAPRSAPHADGPPAAAAAGGDGRSASSRTKRRRGGRDGGGPMASSGRWLLAPPSAHSTRRSGVVDLQEQTRIEESEAVASRRIN